MQHRCIGLLLLVVLAASLPGCAGTRPPGDSDAGAPSLEAADLARFRDALEPYGDWITDSPYGTVWIPYALPAGWRPYTTGRWLCTDHGWMWLEEEPWGWAAFHYGRWAFDDRLGWVWLPGNSWAPAWVAWRSGQGYIGWAPLGPEADWRRAGEKPEALSRGIDASAWSFVRTREFPSISISSSVLPVGRTTTILPQTRGAGRYVPYGARIAERGFSESGAVERTRRFRVADAAMHRQNRGPVVQGSTVEIYRPEAIQQKEPTVSTRSRRPPGSRAQEIAERERREQERFEERMANERRRLRREQEREIRQRPESVSEDRLRRRQKDEIEAQERFERRERAVMESRRERFREEG